MTLNDLLSRYTGPADVNVLKPETPNGVTYIPGDGGIIPQSLRDRKASRFEIECGPTTAGIPLLVVHLKEVS